VTILSHSKNLVVKVKRLCDDAKIPQYMSEGAAGCDVYASHDAIIPAQGRALVKTGLILEIPSGWECQVRSRSGLALKQGIVVLNQPGTIDFDFRSDVGVILFNTTVEDFIVTKGDRIAQFVFSEVPQVAFEVVNNVSETARGTGGFGSTGGA
jgi:dUTP pyrophosphatase